MATATLRTAATVSNSAIRIFCYGSPSAGDCDSSDMLTARTKLGAILRVSTQRYRPTLVIAWHIGLLKLLPFMDARRARTVLFLHGVESWRRPALLTGRLLDRVDYFLANSDHTWRRFLSHAPAFASRPHRVVHLGMQAPASKCVAPGKTPAALMLSRMVRGEDYKGHREMLHAWPHVMRCVPNAQLWIAGDGDLKSRLEQVARRAGLADSVRFLGTVTEIHKQELITQSRCLAMPSRGEGFGLVYLEAMRLGRPCLVSTCDAGREVVNPPESGLAADPDDPEALADAVSQLITPGPQWDRWSAQARARYESQFTAEHFQHRLLDALGDLLPD